jgi:hypothetical protein
LLEVKIAATFPLTNTVCPTWSFASFEDIWSWAYKDAEAKTKNNINEITNFFIMKL